MSPLIPLKVLMIGNSFSICVLQYTPEVAGKCGAGVDICSLYIGGCSLARHCENIRRAGEEGFAPYEVNWNFASLGEGEEPALKSAVTVRETDKGSKMYGNIPQMLAAEKWDIVTIQQASPKSWDPGSYHPYADDLISTIRELAPQAKIAIQETWSYCNGDKRICDQAAGGPGEWGIDQRGMFDRLAANYADLGAKYGFDIIPTGTAIQLFRERLPVSGIDDDVVGSMKPVNGELSGDSIHLNNDGKYLQACVWAAKLLGADVESMDWAPSPTMRHPENAALIRKCAADAVRGVKPARRAD